MKKRINFKIKIGCVKQNQIISPFSLYSKEVGSHSCVAIDYRVRLQRSKTLKRHKDNRLKFLELSFKIFGAKIVALAALAQRKGIIRSIDY
jgi:hypothetical protein